MKIATDLEIKERGRTKELVPLEGVAAGTESVSRGRPPRRTVNRTAVVDLILAHPGRNKVQVTKTVKEVTGLSLKEAQALVDNAPSKILTSLPVSDVAAAQHILANAGATTVVTPAS